MTQLVIVSLLPDNVGKDLPENLIYRTNKNVNKKIINIPPDDGIIEVQAVGSMIRLKKQLSIKYRD